MHEIIYLGRVGDLPRPAAVPINGLSVCRTVGMHGTACPPRSVRT